MVDTIDPYTAAGIIAVLGVVALYRCYILPGYRKDQAEARHARDAC